MAHISMKMLLESGVHFGHQTNRWNPKMKPYIFGARNGIYIVDLQQTVQLFEIAYEFIVERVASGKTVLFLGTKRQAQESIKSEAERCGMPYVNQRWLGGMLTNFVTIKKSIDQLNKFDQMFEDESVNSFPKKEIMKLQKQREKLQKVLGGIRYMEKLPGALFVIDPKREAIGIKEAHKLGIPIIAIVDTNCDPDDIDYVIPGNDDAIRAIKLFSSKIADAVEEGQKLFEERVQAESDKEESEEELDVPESVTERDEDGNQAIYATESEDAEDIITEEV
ncbi:MAG: 30S ribosomal protein S2 [Syntrophales bacterium]|nr:30S ribosomal protein S2 [Syntrophales bacterium]MDY0043796.1 30S ribosomal protein S2 [Syntrophales bacterium]